MGELRWRQIHGLRKYLLLWWLQDESGREETGTSFQILLGGGKKCPPQAIEFQDGFFIEFLNAWKRADQTTPPSPPRHVLANFLNGIVILHEYILTNSHFQLEKNEIVIEPIEKAYGRKSFDPWMKLALKVFRYKRALFQM